MLGGVSEQLVMRGLKVFMLVRVHKPGKITPATRNPVQTPFRRTEFRAFLRESVIYRLLVYRSLLETPVYHMLMHISCYLGLPTNESPLAYRHCAARKL